MSCPQCGEICECSSGEDYNAPSRWKPESGVSVDAGAPASLEPKVGEPGPRSDSCANSPTPELPPEDSAAWRQEVAARLNRYQSRRKPRPPRYPSLRLRFESDDAARVSAEPAFQQTSGFHQALALDDFAANLSPTLEASPPETRIVPEPPPELPNPVSVPPVTARIIEFPRLWTPPLPAPDELAEPVMTQPRILEAPEFVPPPPALGGIIIEPAQRPETEKRPGIDVPLQSAPLGQRVLSALVDDFIIGMACALFGYVFWKMTAIQPPRLQMLEMAAGAAGIFWAGYQYLLVVYAGTTPGLRLAQLEIARFDGSPAGRGVRRWRVLASYLSAISLGLGYAWVFLDEDSLCWHDRITHTYLAPRRPDADPPGSPASTR